MEKIAYYVTEKKKLKRKQEYVWVLFGKREVCELVARANFLFYNILGIKIPFLFLSPSSSLTHLLQVHARRRVEIDAQVYNLYILLYVIGLNKKRVCVKQVLPWNLIYSDVSSMYIWVNRQSWTCDMFSFWLLALIYDVTWNQPPQVYRFWWWINIMRETHHQRMYR